ncbi:protein FAR1-RELATED SEQUENCE 5-like [Sesbania bispinosa]|nr:protein FAR1-RELATED SEQUENCE 5-like [Sesbania bispinosa]
MFQLCVDMWPIQSALFSSPPQPRPPSPRDLPVFNPAGAFKQQLGRQLLVVVAWRVAGEGRLPRVRSAIGDLLLSSDAAFAFRHQARPHWRGGELGVAVTCAAAGEGEEPCINLDDDRDDNDSYGVSIDESVHGEDSGVGGQNEQGELVSPDEKVRQLLDLTGDDIRMLEFGSEHEA